MLDSGRRYFEGADIGVDYLKIDPGKTKLCETALICSTFACLVNESLGCPRVVAAFQIAKAKLFPGQHPVFKSPHKLSGADFLVNVLPHEKTELHTFLRRHVGHARFIQRNRPAHIHTVFSVPLETPRGDRSSLVRVRRCINAGAFKVVFVVCLFINVHQRTDHCVPWRRARVKRDAFMNMPTCNQRVFDQN